MRKLKWIPYGKHEISKHDIKAVVEVLKNENITQGKRVPMLEERVSRYVNAKGSVATNSATSALHIACMAIGLNKGDRLWTTPVTFVASANCGLYCGAKVDFVDINKKTGLMDIEKLEEKLKNAKKKNKLPKIIIPVHLTGTSCEMQKIYKLSKKYKFKIIEDASHAIGGKYKESRIGSCKYSDICVFSLHPVKIITSGEGGIATTNNANYEHKMRMARSHGINRERKEMSKRKTGKWEYEQQNLGYNYRMSDIHAALGLSQLSRLKQIVKERNNQLRNYRGLLKGEKIKLLKIPKGIVSPVHIAVIKIKGMKKRKQMELFEGMRRRGIGVQLHYNPVHLHPYFKRMGYKKGDFRNSEIYSESVVTLPLYPGLSKQDQEYVVRCLINITDKFRS